MLDLKVVHAPGDSGVLSGYLWPSPSTVDGIESLVQRITMCLMSAPGDSSIDPEYGADLRGMVSGLTGTQPQEAKRRIQAALRKVLTDLTRDPAPTPEESLLDLRMSSAEYDVELTAWVVEVEVETVANPGVLFQVTV